MQAKEAIKTTLTSTKEMVGMYLSDLAHFDEMDAEYRRFFSDPMPARTTIQSDLIGFDVEGDAVVFLGE